MRGATLLLAAALLLPGCAGRGVLPEPESRDASAFFAGASSAPIAPASSFSGVAETGGGTFPFVAGIRSAGGEAESLGIFDPLGRLALMVSNDGATVSIEAGPVAGALSALDGKKAPAGGVSLGRILQGAPGYPVSGGDLRRSGDGGWILSDGRQTLVTDSGRRFLSRAEYEIAGKTVKVSYPGREAATVPPLVRAAVNGASIELRRDVE